MQADYTKGVNHYPTTQQAALKLLNTFPKISSPTQLFSHGTAFVQKGGYTRNNRNEGNLKTVEDEDSNDKAAEKDKRKDIELPQGTPTSPHDKDACHESAHAQVRLPSYRELLDEPDDDDYDPPS